MDISTTDYDGFWNMVLGASRSADEIVSMHFGTEIGNDARAKMTRDDISAWLIDAELEAARQDTESDPEDVQEAWVEAEHHNRAIDELVEAGALGYRIVQVDCDGNHDWNAIGHVNCFRTEDEADEALESLMALGPEWDPNHPDHGPEGSDWSWQVETIDY